MNKNSQHEFTNYDQELKNRMHPARGGAIHEALLHGWPTRMRTKYSRVCQCISFPAAKSQLASNRHETIALAISPTPTKEGGTKTMN